MAEPFDDTLVGRIYEAAVVPEKWPELLGEMSRAVDGAGAVLLTAGSDQVRGIPSDDLKDIFEEFVRDGWAAINQRPVRLVAANYFGFVRDNDFFTDEEMSRDPVYRDFLRKRGLGWATGTLVEVPSGESVIFSFERAYQKGPVPLHIVQRFDALRPHLARSAVLSARLGLEHARHMADALQSLGWPAAVLRDSGRLLAVNDLFGQLMPVLALDQRDRMHLLDQIADPLFAAALARDALIDNLAGVHSIPVAATEAHPPLILHLLPIFGVAHDFFTQASSLLVVTPVDRAVAPTARVLQGLFDLTPAEARVAGAISEAQTIESIAQATGVSLETVRSQLKAVLGKTGLSRQQELISLLAGKTLPTRRRSG